MVQVFETFAMSHITELVILKFASVFQIILKLYKGETTVFKTKSFNKNSLLTISKHPISHANPRQDCKVGKHFFSLGSLRLLAFGISSPSKFFSVPSILPF